MSERVMAKGQSVRSNKVKEKTGCCCVYKVLKGPVVVKRLFLAPKEHVFGPCSMAGKDR